MKTLDDFHARRDRPDGRQARCKDCARAQMKARWERDREHLIEQAKAWRAANPGYSTKWARENRDAHLRHRQKSRSMRLGLFVEDVDRSVVWEKAGGRCGICEQPVELLEMELDHIVALSNGGEHSYANVQPAHRRCNRAKAIREVPRQAGARDPERRREIARMASAARWRK